MGGWSKDSLVKVKNQWVGGVGVEPSVSGRVGVGLVKSVWLGGA